MATVKPNMCSYAPIDKTPKLDMRASIHQRALSSGYKLTIIADQVGTTIFGANTIKDGQTIIFSGKVSNLVTSLQLTTDGGPSEVVLLNIASTDNVNFIGSLTLFNPSISSSASGIIVGKIKNGFLPNSSSVNINNTNAVGFQFYSASNFSDHCFNANDNVTSIGGQVKTGPLWAANTPSEKSF